MGTLSRILQVVTLIYIALNVVASVDAAPEEDLVTNLPGLPSLGYKIYSGYITVDEKNGRAIFYFFVEAQNNSQSKPLTLWLQGGPGCSSFGVGVFAEHGPFKIHKNAIVMNPYSWNLESNMLYVESPAGVGFSYSNTTSDYETNDNRTAQDSFNFLQGWVKKFPEYENRAFYIAGEGYGGYYVPQLAAVLVQNKPFLQLKGIMIGNPTIDIDEDVSVASTMFFFWSHGQISDDTYKTLNEKCEYFTHGWNLTQPCEEFWGNVYANETGDIDWHNILADTCASDSNGILNYKLQKINFKLQTRFTTASLNQVQPEDPCHTFDMVSYLRRKDVQAAIHAHVANASVEYSVCSDIIDYNITEKTVQPQLKLLIENDVRVWVYSGDQDSVVPFGGTRKTVDKFRHAVGLNISSLYQPWYTAADNQVHVGGWTISYGQKLLFATVRGAGHLVPLNQPVRALQLFNSFLSGSNLPLRSG